MNKTMHDALEFSDTGHEVGATYHSIYWDELYTVESVKSHPLGDLVTVYWHRQRRRTTHSTNRGHDPIVCV
jgi:hypothetical protein